MTQRRKIALVEDHALIAIGFRDGLPAAMEVNDAFGRVSVFGFSGIERNARIPPDDFSFTPPPGVDTVRQ